MMGGKLKVGRLKWGILLPQVSWTFLTGSVSLRTCLEHCSVQFSHSVVSNPLRPHGL